MPYVILGDTGHPGQAPASPEGLAWREGGRLGAIPAIQVVTMR